MAETPRMPDFVHGTLEFRHTLDSALAALGALGVADRVVLEASGPGWRPESIVRQSPESGTELTPKTRIVLTVSSSRGTDHLPFPVRTAAIVAKDAQLNEEAIGYERVTSIFDHQVLKLRHTVRRGGGFFDLRPDRPDIARRWIGLLFGLQLDDDWSTEQLYRLAQLLPFLHRYAGTSEGLTLAFRTVLELTVRHIVVRPTSIPIDADEATRLGTQASFLGVSTVVGGPVSSTSAEISLWVPDVGAYRAQCRPSAARVRATLYQLFLPLHCTTHTERWAVGHPTTGVRLVTTDPTGTRPRLSQGSYLGSASSIGVLS